MRCLSRPRARALAAAMIAGFALAGCASFDPMRKSLPENPNRLTYTTVERDHDVHFVAALATLSADERTRLGDFLRNAEARPGDQVALGAGGSVLDQARIESVAAFLRAMGISEIDTAPPPGVPNIVSVVLRQMVAVKPQCGEWPALGTADMLNSPASYLGCANASNLYNMVVDKRDLAVGRTPGPADAEPAIRAVETYREGKSPLATNGAPSPDQSGEAGASAAGAATAAAGLAGIGSALPTATGSGNGQ